MGDKNAATIRGTLERVTSIWNRRTGQIVDLSNCYDEEAIRSWEEEKAYWIAGQKEECGERIEERSRNATPEIGPTWLPIVECSRFEECIF